MQLDGVAERAAVEDAEAMAVRREAVGALLGWSPATGLADLARRLAPRGGAVVRLPVPGWIDPPTRMSARGVARAFQPLVDTYGTVPYADVNPAALAGVAYAVMFGMMFGDVAHGVLLVACGLLLASGRPVGMARFRRAAPFVVGAGVAATGFGFAYGDFFGPTHIVPTLWLAPLDHPTTLLASGVAVGAGLLTVSYGLGTVNRWREGGVGLALVATSGGAGALLYLGVAGLGLGWYFHAAAALVAGGLLAASGLILGFLGCYAETGGAVQATVGLFDATVRIGTNTVSFARLAAFGLTHAALSQLVWQGSASVWHRGPALWVLAGAVFLFGNAVALGLEGLVCAIQAMRLEYYELFSRIFTGEGRPFLPWCAEATAPRVPSPTEPPAPRGKERVCSPG